MLMYRRHITCKWKCNDVSVHRMK